MQEVYEIANDTETAKVFPGIPSYFDNQNKGAYAYLTGSSSWFMLTLITQIFGIKGKYGALCIEPKLSIDYFNEEGISEISTIFSGRNINVVFVNKDYLDFGSYSIKEIAINGSKINISSSSTKNIVVLDNFKELLDQSVNSIIINLE
jgi:cellobiose phosphorylase